ncbi:MAG: DUF695 domain-containing protein [Anaerolineae bacterium]|nr:DUF695 domain-containing protein [Anaerolineae bacterium]
MFWRKKKHQIVGDSWNMYAYQYGDGNQAVISFDTSLASEEHHEGYNTSMRVIVYIPLECVMANGLPARQALPELDNIEQRLVESLEKGAVDCKLGGRMTYGGMREFVFQVEDIEKFRDSATSLSSSVVDYKVELREQEGWGFFDQKVRPSPVFWQQIKDREVIEQLIQAGSDPQAIHNLEHTFVGDPKILKRLKGELITNGFELVSDAGDTLVMSKGSKLDLNQVFGLTSKLSGYCRHLGISYDGWGAMVVK